MNKERIKAALRPYYYPVCDFCLDKSVRLSEKLRSHDYKTLENIWQAILAPFRLSAYRTITNKDYCTQFSGTYTALSSEQTGMSIGCIKGIDQIPETKNVQLAELYITRYNDMVVRGDSDCVLDLKHKIVISDYAANIDTTVYANPRGVIRVQHLNCALVETKKVEREIDCGLTLLTPGSTNLYHCIYDCMLKLYLVRKHNILPDYPLLVGEGIKSVPQLFELFNLVVPAEREIIWVKNGSTCLVHNLAYIPSANFIPFQINDFDALNVTDFKYDVNLMKEYRDFLLQFKSNDHFSKKFFLSRKGFSRRGYNEEELLEVVKRHNIDIVHPENLTFRQQMAMFNGADCIVGATGAAFTNVLFCKSGCTSVCMTGVDLNLPIFTAGAYTSQSKLIYLIGSLTGNALRYKIQSAFRIEPQQLDKLLTECEKYETLQQN